MKVVCLWSAGKDSCLASYKAIQNGHEVVTLVNFTGEDGNVSLSHNLSASLIKQQAEATGFPILQKAMPKKNFRKEFISLMSGLREKEAIEGIVFGDIFLKEHKDWVDSVCEELGLSAVMPLWEVDTLDLIREFIRSGFKALLVTANEKLLGEAWLGREIDDKFVSDLRAMGNIDPCGEKGEFHTFVFDGPIFKNPLPFSFGNKTLKDGRWLLELK